MKLELINARKEPIETGDLVSCDGVMGFIIYNSLASTVYPENNNYDDSLTGELAEPYLFLALDDMQIAEHFEDMNHVNKECQLILKNNELVLKKGED